MCVKKPYEIAVCPVCSEGLLYAGWEPEFVGKDEIGFTYLPVIMDEHHESHVIVWCPICKVSLRITFKYVSIVHLKDDGTKSAYFNWETNDVNV